MDYKHGFTLAEVLITLVIIGVVAALTIPTAIAKYQKTETVSRLKKCYSTLLDAAKKHQAATGVYITDFDTSLSAQEFMERYFNPYLQIAKHCPDDKFVNCYGLANDIRHIDNTEYNPLHYGVILNDGSFLGANSRPSGMDFIVDINGAKKPNKVGRDIFSFYLINPNTFGEDTYGGCEQKMKTLKAGIYPGSYGDCYSPHANFSRAQLLGTSVDRSCNRNASQLNNYSGTACAAVIMMDGWQIKDDYPW